MVILLSACERSAKTGLAAVSWEIVPTLPPLPYSSQSDNQSTTSTRITRIAKVKYAHHQSKVMSAFNPKRLPTPIGTHFLCYPLYSPRSSLQLYNLIQKLKDDELSLHCPQKAFRKPKSFHLRIAPFSFRTQQNVEAASELLRNLDINRMLQNAEPTATTANFNNQKETATKATIGEDDHEAWVPPLSVSLVGLSAGLSSEEQLHKEVHKAHFFAIDYSERLHSLSTQIVQRFISAEIENVGTYKSPYSGSIVIDAWRARQTRHSRADDGAKVKWRFASYDTRGLIEKYKDVTLAEDIPLEKLSLCKSRRIATFKGDRNQVLVDEYYEEVESIPLPQYS